MGHGHKTTDRPIATLLHVPYYMVKHNTVYLLLACSTSHQLPGPPLCKTQYKHLPMKNATTDQFILQLKCSNTHKIKYIISYNIANLNHILVLQKGRWYSSRYQINSQPAIVPAAVNITETAASDIPTVTRTAAVTLFVRQPQLQTRQQPANVQIIW